MSETEINWPEALRTNSREHSAAVSKLREILHHGLRMALSDRSDVSEAHLEDFTQEAILRILDQLDQFSGRSQFTTWAHTIAINVAFTELRRKRYQDVSLDALISDGRQLSEIATHPANAAENDEERKLILEALRLAISEQLSDKQRAIIVGELCDIPVDQLVELLGTNRNAAYKLLHDARRALKQHLEAAGISAQHIRTTFAL